MSHAGAPLNLLQLVILTCPGTSNNAAVMQ
jgi:hypothetical protein